MASMTGSYSIMEQNNQLVLRTVLYKYGSGSALNAMVYNRELGAILASGGVTALVYLALFPSGPGGWKQWIIPVALFFGFYVVIRRWVFREHTTVTTMDRTSGTITVARERAFGRTLTKILRVAEVRFIEAEEQPPPDESDIQEIVKWHKMAEPGVHATPLPLYKVNFVLADGSRVLVHTDVVLEHAQAVRQRLGEFLGLA